MEERNFTSDMINYCKALEKDQARYWKWVLGIEKLISLWFWDWIRKRQDILCRTGNIAEKGGKTLDICWGSARNSKRIGGVGKWYWGQKGGIRVDGGGDGSEFSLWSGW